MAPVHPPSTPPSRSRIAAWIGLALLATLLVWLTSRPPSTDADPAQALPPRTAATSASPRSSAPSATPLPAIPDRFAGRPVIAERSVQVESERGTITRQTRLIRIDEHKDSLVRVQQDWLHASPTATPQLLHQQAVVADHLIVRPVDPTITADRLLQALHPLDVSVRRRMPASGIWILAFPNPDLDTLDRAQQALAEKTKVLRYAEPDFIVHALVTPNDTRFETLWALNNTGQDGGTADADINAPEAWTLSTGRSAVVVGVIDTGIDYTHPDLAANIWTNPTEIAGNGIDDDNNGYIDDIHGWDFANNDADPMDDHNHGTHCSGTIGGVGDNATGVTGVCWQVSLAGLKFLTASGSGASSDATEAIAYATLMGFDLTSNSWGGGGFSQSLNEALNAADAAGVLAVCAAGNESSNNDTVSNYPSNYPGDNIIAVAATTRNDTLSAFSNFGLTQVDLAAPGSEILSTVPGGRYATFSGTSMATPHVAGVCALLKSWRPLLTHHQIRDLILATTTFIPSLEGRCVTGGRLNAANALAAAEGLLLSVSPPHLEASLGGPFPADPLQARLDNFSSAPIGWTLSTDTPWLTVTLPTGTLPVGGKIAVDLTLTAAANLLPPGLHTATLTAIHSETHQQQTRTFQLRIQSPAVVETLLNTDPGWSRHGEWSFGQPTGGGGRQFGVPDPTSGATGTHVFGVELQGDYSTAVGTAQHLTLGPVDLSRHHDSVLEFQRWLNADYQPWVEATVEVSANGTQWSPVWTNGTTPTTDAAWSRHQFDISHIADGSPTVFIRWRHRVGASNAYPLSGWNLDDVRIRATPDARLVWQPNSATLTEGTPATTFTLRAEPPPQHDVTIHFSTDAPHQIDPPPSLVLPAGASEVLVALAALDDLLPDGTQTAALLAETEGYFADALALTLHDNESAVLSLSSTGTFAEGSGTLPDVVTLSLPHPAAADLWITLHSDTPQALTVPPSVLLPQASNSVQVPVTILDNARIEPTTHVLLTASITNWPPAILPLQILDNESRHLTLELPPHIGEGIPPLRGDARVHIAGTTASGLTVALSTPDPTWIQIPSSVFIPPHQTQATFTITPIDNATSDGTQTYTVLTTTPGFVSAQETSTLYDDELPSPALQPTPADGAPAVDPESDLAWSYISGLGSPPDAAEVYFGTSPLLTSADQITTTTATAVALDRLTPGSTYYWRVDTLRSNTRFPGTTWSFHVPPVGPADRFAWTSIPSPQWIGTAFPATVTALDAAGNVVADFSADAALAPVNPSPILISEVNLGTTDSIELTNVGTQTADLAGWKIYPYHNAGTPAPLPAFIFPPGTQLPPGQVLTLQEGGTPPGTYPLFRTGTNLDWVNNTFNTMAVLLTDPNGNPVDFVASNAMLVGTITQPLPIPPSQWTGSPLPVTSAASHTYHRIGSVDQNDARDWQSAPPTTFLTNPHLTLPFPVALDVPFSPRPISGFVNGIWTGWITPQRSGVHRLRITSHDTLTGLSNPFTVQSLGAVTLTLSPDAVLIEGDGTRLNLLTLTLPAPTTDTLTVSVQSHDPTEIASTTVTLPAGSTTLALPITVVDDLDIDGPHTVTVTVAVPSYDPTSISLSVLDNEVGTLAFHLPAEVTESQGVLPLAASITVSTVVTAPLTILLSSSDVTEVGVPASVTIPANSDSVAFDLTLIDDILLDGPQTVSLTASVAGWPDTTTTLVVRDDESSAISLTAVPSGSEGDPSLVNGGTVSVGGIATADILLSLSSSDVTEVGVPASVTIPAGLSSITFPIAFYDDDEIDGPQDVTLSVQGLGQSAVTHTVKVFDNDPASLLLSPIGGPHFDHSSFPFTVRALDLNGQLMDKVTSKVSLSALSPADVALPVTPASLLGFSGGIWADSVTVAATGTQLRLRVHCPTATADSNPFEIRAGPRLRVDPDQIAVRIPSGEMATRSLTLHNDGNADLQWQVQSSVGDPPATLSRPDSTSPSFHPQSTPDDPPLEDLIAVINGGHTRLTSLIPNRWDFRDGITGQYIADGGQDMYDNGNFLSTNLSPANTWLYYSDNQITPSPSHLGPHGRYFTRKVPGLFLLAADLDSVTTFRISGNLGADGSGQQSSTRLFADCDGVPWTAFSKRVFGTSDGSVNHLIITPDRPSLAQTIGTTTDSDFHQITGLSGPTRLYHLVFSSLTGGFIDDTTLQTLFETFLELTRNTVWLSTTPSTGTIAPGHSAIIDVNCATTSLAPGLHSGHLEITSNDPTASPPPTTSVTLTVTSPLDALQWSPVAGEIVDDAPFPVTLSALTTGPFPATDFSGEVRLCAIAEDPTTGTRQLPVEPTVVLLSAGTWSGTITVLEPALNVRLHAERSGAASVVQAWSNPFNVEPIPQPNLTAEPPFTRGTRNLIHWTSAQPGEFQLQHALQPDFIDAITSPWITTNSLLIEDLISGQPYHYRLRRRTPAPITQATPVGTFSTSAWTPSVISTQDVEAPSLTSQLRPDVTHSTTRPQFLLRGSASDPSGIQSVHVNAELASSTNHFRHWSHPVTLMPGANSIVLTATDQADAPPFTTTQTHALHLVPDDDGDGLPSSWESLHDLNPHHPDGLQGALGDPDLDGLSNLLEYAFHSKPNSSNPSPCSCDLFTDPNTGAPHFQLHFPRRFDTLDLDYQILASHDLDHWPDASLTPTEVQAIPNADGFTETVTVRLGPLAFDSPPLFLKIRVILRP